MRRTTLFCKRPDPGGVKTRLVPPLSELGAAELYAAMLEDTLEACLGERGFETALRFSPAEADEWFAGKFPRVVDRAPQRGADLAQRLTAHFADCCSALGTEVVIASDAPCLAMATVVSAHEALEGGADLVLSPDAGGGYTLIGLASPQPALVCGVVMSSDQMAARTLAIARDMGLDVQVLAKSRDVDLPQDLELLAHGLAGLAPSLADFPTRTAACLRRLLPELFS